MYISKSSTMQSPSGVITADAADALRALYRAQRSTADPRRRAISPAHRLQRYFRFDRGSDPAVRGRLDWPERSGRRPGCSSAITASRAEPSSLRCRCGHSMGPGAVLHRASGGWRCRRSCCCSRSSAGCWRRPASACVQVIGPDRFEQSISSLGSVIGAVSCCGRRRRRVGALAPFPCADHRCRRCGGGCWPVPGDRPGHRPAGQTARAAKNLILGFMLLLGVGVFLFAMWWDASDRARLTRRSDVAFWLHLLAAPMIAHPIFTLLGLNNGSSPWAKRWWSSACTSCSA